MDLKDVMSGATVPNQNLINKNNGTPQEKRPGFWRAAVLDVMSILSAFALGYAYFQFVVSGLSAWYPAVCFLVFSSASVMQAFLTVGSSRRALVVAAEAIGVVAPFVFYDNPAVVLIAAVAAFLFFSLGYLGGRAEVHNEIEIQFFKATHNVEGRVVTALLLAMLILYVPQAQGNELFMSQGSFQTLFNWTASFASNFYPGIPLTGSFADFSKAIATVELENNPSFGNLTQTQQTDAIQQTEDSFSATVAKATGVAPTPDEPLSDVLYRYFVAILTGLRNQFQDQFILAWIIILFILLRMVAVLAVWAAQLASLVAYEILLSVNFMHIEESTQTKEVVVY